jgi:multimeric flavodoxin WrbA
VDAAAPAVVAVVGSPRRHGNTVALVAAVLDELEARGAACKTITLSSLNVGPCLAHDSRAELAAVLGFTSAGSPAAR